MAKKVAAKKKQVFSPMDEAKKLSPATIRKLTTDVSLVVSNVKHCAQSLRTADAALTATVMNWNPAWVTRFSAIGSALKEVGDQITKSEQKHNDDLQQNIDRAWALRRMMLGQAWAAVNAGLVPAKDLDAMMNSNGAWDCARDCMDLAKFFTKHWEVLAKKTAVTQAHIDDAKTCATAMLATMKAKKTKMLTPAELAKARELRDRLYTLLSWTYDELWGAAAMVFGRTLLDDMFPALNAPARVTAENADTAPTFTRKMQTMTDAEMAMAMTNAPKPSAGRAAAKAETAKAETAKAETTKAEAKKPETKKTDVKTANTKTATTKADMKAELEAAPAPRASVGTAKKMVVMAAAPTAAKKPTKLATPTNGKPASTTRRPASKLQARSARIEQAEHQAALKTVTIKSRQVQA